MNLSVKYYLLICLLTFAQLVKAQSEIPIPSDLNTDLEKFAFFYAKSQEKSISDLDSAIIYGRLANDFAKKCKLDSVEMQAVFNLAYCQFRKGDYEPALKNNDYAISIAKKLHNKSYLFKAYRVAGAINCIEDRTDIGIGYFDKALQIAKQLNDSLGIAISYENIGRSYLGLPTDQQKNAEKFLLKALSIYKSINANESELISVYRNLSEAATKQSEKINYINKAIDIAEKKNEPIILADLYMIKGRRYESENDFRKSVVWFEKSLFISKKNNYSPNIEATLISLIYDYRKLNDYDKSYFYLQEYDSLFDYTKNGPNNKKYYLKNASLVYAGQQNYKKAYELALIYGNILDSLGDLKLNEQFIKYNKAFELEQKNKEIAQQQVYLLEQKSKKNQIIFLAVVLLVIAIGVYQWFFFRQKKKKQMAEHELLKEKEMNNLRTNFLENIAHEIRTPITLIKGYLTLAVEKADNKKDLVKNISSAMNNSDKVLSNANEILELLKLEKGKLPVRNSEINLEQFFRRVFYSFESLAEIKKIDLEYLSNIASDIVINSDENRIEKILNNFISNAIKFSQSRSKIILEAIVADSELTIKVTDFGQGIPLNEQNKIFDRFYQSPTTNNIGGVGVGLSVAKEFAESLNGSISVISEFDKGATFILHLPVQTYIQKEKSEKIISEPVKIKNRELNINNKATILIVEDNPEMNVYLSEILSEQYNCEVAFDGVEGLQKVKTKKYNLIISDVMMPQMDGFELKEKVNALTNSKNIPFIFITAKAQVKDRIAGYNLGIDDYITKPFVKEELLARIRMLLINKKERDHWVKENLDFIDNDSNVEEQLVNKIKSIILKNLSEENYKVTDLAKEVAYSQRQLTRLLKKATGLSPVQFILEIRLQKAYNLLEEKKFATLAEVRNYVGIPSASHFNNKFVERYGIKPSAVQK